MGGRRCCGACHVGLGGSEVRAVAEENRPIMILADGMPHVFPEQLRVKGHDDADMQRAGCSAQADRGLGGTRSIELCFPADLYEA